MIIRDCLPDDMAQVTAIYTFAVTHFAATYELEAPSLDDMIKRRATILRRGFPYLVAEDAGVILGFAYGNMFRERMAYRFMVEDSIYLSPDAQRKGVGSLLLGDLIIQCTARGFRQMVAIIGDSEFSLGSIGVHRRLGFKETGRMEGSGFKFGRWLDTMVMQIALNEGRQTLPDGSTVADNLQP
jgi:L-amino acid N-acyltransferase YncA